MSGGFSLRNAGLLLASAALAGVIAVQLSQEFAFTPTHAAAPDRSVEVPSPAPLHIEPPAKSKLEGILARPLFFASRRPMAAIEAPSVLVGIMVLGESRIALLNHPTEGLVMVQPGQELGGWQIDDIGENDVSLLRDERFEVLTLRKAAPDQRAKPDEPSDGEGDDDDDKDNEEDVGRDEEQERNQRSDRRQERDDRS